MTATCKRAVESQKNGFFFATGRVTGFVGPNGAGKSTSMQAMVGLVRPDHGEVRDDGRRHDELDTPATVVGSVLDSRCMHPGRTARNHLRVSCTSPARCSSPFSPCSCWRGAFAPPVAALHAPTPRGRCRGLVTGVDG